MPAKFQIKKVSNEKFYFNYFAANGEIVLTSQMYASKVTAKKGIASVQNDATDIDQFEGNTNKKREHYFVLKAKNQQVIGTSEGYAGRTGVKNAGVTPYFADPEILSSTTAFIGDFNVTGRRLHSPGSRLSTCCSESGLASSLR